MLRLGMLPFACSGMLFKDASSGTLRLRRRTKGGYCGVLPRRSTASVPWGSGRCGAAEFRVLDVAVDAMAAERAEHERVQVQVRARARMPLLPRCCGVLAGGSLTACCMALTCCSAIARCGRWRAARQPCEPGLCRALLSRCLVVASVDGSDAYRAEAEPFTAKRSGTG